MKDVEVDLFKSNAIEYINCHSRESEKLFSQMKLVKNGLQCVFAQLIRIAIEGPEFPTPSPDHASSASQSKSKSHPQC